MRARSACLDFNLPALNEIGCVANIALDEKRRANGQFDPVQGVTHPSSQQCREYSSSQEFIKELKQISRAFEGAAQRILKKPVRTALATAACDDGRIAVPRLAHRAASIAILSAADRAMDSLRCS
jgi:hypothetical protein